MAFSGLSLMRFLMTYTNWPTVRSAGTRYLQSQISMSKTSRPGSDVPPRCPIFLQMTLAPLCPAINFNAHTKQ